MLPIFSFRFSLPFSDRICWAPMIKRSPLWVYPIRRVNKMLRTIFSVTGKKQSAEVILVDPFHTIFPTWWAQPAYFVTISNGQFFSCPDEETCIEKAKEETLTE